MRTKSAWRCVPRRNTGTSLSMMACCGDLDGQRTPRSRDPAGRATSYGAGHLAHQQAAQLEQRLRRVIKDREDAVPAPSDVLDHANHDQRDEGRDRDQPEGSR